MTDAARETGGGAGEGLKWKLDYRRTPPDYDERDAHLVNTETGEAELLNDEECEEALDERDALIARMAGVMRESRNVVRECVPYMGSDNITQGDIEALEDSLNALLSTLPPEDSDEKGERDGN